MGSLTQHGREFKRRLEQRDGLDGWLEESDVQAACCAAGHRGRRCFWTPAVTVLTFLRQVVEGGSCRAAVARTVLSSVAGDAGLGATGAGWVSGDPSAYSQARQRLPLAVWRGLARRTVERLRTLAELLTASRASPTAWRESRAASVESRAAQGSPASSVESPAASTGARWCGRRVLVVDGTGLSMPDTPALQKAFPQPPAQRRGCGFPVARMVAVFCWASGGLLEWVIDSRKTGELNLFRRLFERLEKGVVVVADRLFCSYYDLAALRGRAIDCVCRLHGSRAVDLRRGRRLAPGDHLLTWNKPRAQAHGVTRRQWDATPETLTVRCVRVAVNQPGFRTRRLDLITTLLDPSYYPAAALAELYRTRWRAELSLRSFKTTLGLDVLRCRSTPMIHKELTAAQIAYNLIRGLMLHAAAAHGRDPHQLSFAGTQQRIRAALSYWDRLPHPWQRRRVSQHLLKLIAADTLPRRPNRVEPRCVKRRPKCYPCLFEPRSAARQRLLRSPQLRTAPYTAAARKWR